MNERTEQRLDRRLHWGYAIAAGLVALTTWMVKVQMNQNQMAEDMKNHIAQRDAMISKLWEARGQDHDKITQLEQWKADLSR